MQLNNPQCGHKEGQIFQFSGEITIKAKIQTNLKNPKMKNMGEKNPKNKMKKILKKLFKKKIIKKIKNGHKLSNNLRTSQKIIFFNKKNLFEERKKI